MHLAKIEEKQAMYLAGLPVHGQRSLGNRPRNHGKYAIIEANKATKTFIVRA